jgi:hypothetical protein
MAKVNRRWHRVQCPNMQPCKPELVPPNRPRRWPRNHNRPARNDSTAITRTMTKGALGYRRHGTGAQEHVATSAHRGAWPGPYAPGSVSWREAAPLKTGQHLTPPPCHHGASPVLSRCYYGDVPVWLPCGSDPHGSHTGTSQHPRRFHTGVPGWPAGLRRQRQDAPIAPSALIYLLQSFAPFAILAR